jgi:hypothetical protein
MEFIKKLTGVKYGDYEGFASVDTHSGTELINLCEQKGIDLNKYFPIGFNIHESERIGHEKIYLTVYLIDTNLAGANYDEIEKYIRNNSGNISLIKKSFQIQYSELPSCIKRYDITVFNRLRDVIRTPEIIDGEDE